MNQYIFLLIAVVVIVKGDLVDETSGGILQGAKRETIDLAEAENIAGKAVLKLLDAKIGKKVQDAATEVTNFLTLAIGHHAESRTVKIQQDKQKEMSLLHLGAIKTIKDGVKKHDDAKKHLKKKKDGSFLVHFKIPYIVTPLKTKKHHHHHHKHHHHKHHYYHHKHKPATHDKPPPIEIHQKPYHHPPAYSPYHHPATRPPSPYTQTATQQTQDYNSAATQAPGSYAPCEGMCAAPCTPQCTPATDCCCCPDANAAVPPAAVPVSLPPPPPPPPMLPPSFAELPLAPGSCVPICKRHCIPKCPEECCGVTKKRDKVEKPSEKKEDMPEQTETKDQQAEQVGKQETNNEQTNDQQTQISEDQRDEGSANEANDEDGVE